MTGCRGFTILMLLLSVGSGCTHLREDRVIAAFTDALANGDLAELKAVTSTDFENKALRRSEALDDLQVLRLPEEPPAIVEVEDVSATEKTVTVTEAEGDSKLLYKLVFDKDSSRWLVDDIFTKQQKSGVTVSKAITEQMDLLLTIRDFLEVWDSDDRESVLAIATPKFREVLTDLPTPWLARITQQVVADTATKSQRKHKPQVAIDGPTAVVRLPRSDGTLQISLEIADGDWKVDDASVQTRREESQIRSVKNRARIIATATQFVEAFRTSDRKTLASTSATELYDEVLKGADLNLASIPDIRLAPQDYELKATVDHATMLVPTPTSVVRLELHRPNIGVGDGSYRVTDVALHNAEGDSEMLLSAFFTATAQVREFHRALTRSDRRQLSNLSSRDFDTRVWAQSKGLPIQLLPMGVVTGKLLKTQPPASNGSTTHVVAQHAGGQATYILLASEGRLVVDDVLVGSADRKRSLRTSLELAMPILAFATGIEANEITNLQRVCSDDFNRLVWSRAKTVPMVQAPVLSQLTKPIRSMRTQPNRALVELGSPNSGAMVSMVKEHQHWVIDEIEIITGVHPMERVELKPAMRTQMIADLKGLPSARTLAMANSNAADKPRKRLQLPRGQSHRRSLAQPTSPVTPSVAMTQTTTPQSAPSPITQASGTNHSGDPGVQHAMTFAPMDEMQPAKFEQTQASIPASMPGIVSPAADAKLLSPPAAVEPPRPDTNVDLDALFASVKPSPTPTTPAPPAFVPKASPAPAPLPGPPVRSAMNQVPVHDTGRVTDPAMHPIQIPQ